MIDTRRKDNPWLTRAAQSLAEALRLSASKELDIEFTELVTGYRLRSNANGTFLDVYLYDSLSSGAGYASKIATDIPTLLDEVEAILSSCDCENACYKCLRHYRNQYVHGMLDRFSALQLLRWGRRGQLAPKISFSAQLEMIRPLYHILEESGVRITIEQDQILIQKDATAKKLVFYPAMWSEPRTPNDTVYVSDALVKYAKPYAVRKIEEELAR